MTEELGDRKRGKRREGLEAWMKSWGVGGGDGGMNEELQGGRRCWWHAWMRSWGREEVLMA